MKMIETEIGGLVIQQFPPAPQEPAILARHISVGAFFDRFGSAKWAILADTAPQVKAVVQDASVRKYIDLDNPDLPAGLQVLSAAGHDVDVAAVTGDPIHATELP